MDCSVVATRHAGLFLVSTTDFFYPNVEDPELQGRIAACNVLSDLYAAGIVHVDTVLMVLAVSTDMAEAERDAVTAPLIRGFTAACAEAGTRVTGGQSIMNPSPIIGGVASATVSAAELVWPGGAKAGDALVLTKPLGTQLAANLWQWRGGARGRHWNTLKHLVMGGLAADQGAAASSIEVPAAAAAAAAVSGSGDDGLIDTATAYDLACAGMSRLNRDAAVAMHSHGAHAATDVTGFGILGHADNLAQHTTDRVRLELQLLPVIRGMARADAAIGHAFRLRLGLSAETSGGLLVALPAERAQRFISALSDPAWVVGRVVAAAADEPNRAVVLPEAVILDVD